MSIVKKILLLGVFLLGFIYQGNSQKNSIGLLVEQVIPSSFEISGDVNQGFYEGFQESSFHQGNAFGISVFYESLYNDKWIGKIQAGVNRYSTGLSLFVSSSDDLNPEANPLGLEILKNIYDFGDALSETKFLLKASIGRRFKLGSFDLEPSIGISAHYHLKDEAIFTDGFTNNNQFTSVFSVDLKKAKSIVIAPTATLGLGKKIGKRYRLFLQMDYVYHRGSSLEGDYSINVVRGTYDGKLSRTEESFSFGFGASYLLGEVD